MNETPTFCDLETGTRYCYLVGGYSEFVDNPIEGHPEYIIYKYSEAETFVDYVELLAQQLMEIVKE